MSAAGGAATGGNPKRLRQLAANLSATFATLIRNPRVVDGQQPAWSSPARLCVGALITIAAVAAAMMFLDDRLPQFARTLPQWLVATFDEITDFGKSGWFLMPVGFLLIVIAAAGVRELPHFTRMVLAALTVRFGFLFLAIGMQVCSSLILKRLIGRAPFRGRGRHAGVFCRSFGARNTPHPVRPYSRLRSCHCDRRALAAHPSNHVWIYAAVAVAVS